MLFHYLQHWRMTVAFHLLKAGRQSFQNCHDVALCLFAQVKWMNNEHTNQMTNHKSSFYITVTPSCSNSSANLLFNAKVKKKTQSQLINWTLLKKMVKIQIVNKGLNVLTKMLHMHTVRRTPCRFRQQKWMTYGLCLLVGLNDLLNHKTHSACQKGTNDFLKHHYQNLKRVWADERPAWTSKYPTVLQPMKTFAFLFCPKRSGLKQTQ